MASFKNFQSDNFKYGADNRSVYNPILSPTISALSETDKEIINSSKENYYRFVSWARWYPDLFLDLIKPKTGGINLHLDQRILMRSIVRFPSTSGVFSRGFGKTFDEVACMHLVGIFYPSIDLALTAQTKANASELLKDKHNELMKFYPILKNEIVSVKFSKDDAEINFLSGSRIDILANAKSSLGQRRKRINVEESNIVDHDLFDNVIAPIVEVPRLTFGKLGIVDPEELNQQINFFTTSGFRGSDEHARVCEMIDNMMDLKGDMVLGSSWRLPCWYGRGSTKSQVLEKKKKMSSVSFAQNYESDWVGNVDGALVGINKVLKLRNLTEVKTKADKAFDYILGVDVARSQSSTNNQSSVAVIEIHRNSNGKIINLNLVNLFTISNSLNFTAQAIEVKKIKRAFNAKVVCIDVNGLGVGLSDELLKETFDPNTGENLGCWKTLNTDKVPEVQNAERCLYELTPQSERTNSITNFISVVDSGILRLLEKRNDIYDSDNNDNYVDNILPFLQTDFLVEEIANLQLETLSTGKLKVKQTSKKYDKDRYSAVEYATWYAMTFENRDSGINFNWNEFCHF